MAIARAQNTRDMKASHPLILRHTSVTGLLLFFAASNFLAGCADDTQPPHGHIVRSSEEAQTGADESTAEGNDDNRFHASGRNVDLSTAEGRLQAMGGSANDDLELVDKDTEWHSTADNPTVSYDVEYKNQGTRTIDATITIACGTVIRNAPRSEKDESWEPFTQETRHLVLSPGQSEHVRGTLRWNATRERMPWLHLPNPVEHQYRELLSCSYAD
jgi:hypothetical protein